MNETETRESMARCVCGHRFSEHELVEGAELTHSPSLPDVWVCSGGRLADVNREDFSPWDCVCGCVLHDETALDTPFGAFLRERNREAVISALTGVAAVPSSGGQPG